MKAVRPVMASNAVFYVDGISQHVREGYEREKREKNVEILD